MVLLLLQIRGLYHEAGFAGKPNTFQFSLHQSWVLGTMKVAWLLAAVIAIVTDTPRLTCSGSGYVPSYKWSQTEIGPIRCEQSDSCLTQKCHSPSFSSYKLNGTMKYLKKINTTKLSGFNDNYNLHMIYIIITPLHTNIFSLTTIIKHLV